MQTARSFFITLFFITTLRANEAALHVESVTVTKQPGQQWLSLPAPSAALLESRCNEISLVFRRSACVCFHNHKSAAPLVLILK